VALTEEETLLIPQGATYVHTFYYTKADEVTPIPITGYTAQMQIRSSIDSSVVLYDSATGGDFTITDDLAGEFTLEIPNATTEAWSFTEAVYDIELTTDGNKKIRYLKGNVEVDPEVTR
jgi:hypothetical protein